MAVAIADDLRCPTCLNIFKDPVMLKCSHSFCRACVKNWWKHKQTSTCPVCRKRCVPPKLSSNLTLKNICETFTQASVETEAFCSLHEEKKKLFCLDHQECVCLICRDAQIHTGHKFRSLHEVAQEHEEKLQKALQIAEEQLKDFTCISDDYNNQGEYIKAQRVQIESKIKKAFEEFRLFLYVEEDSMLSALREEEQKKSQMMKANTKVLSRNLAEISDAIRSTKKHLTADHVSFMNNFHDAMNRIQQLPQKPKMFPGALIDEVKYQGNLKFTVWERMKEMVSYSPVILDPNTASHLLSLSDDLTSVSLNVVEQRRPENPERYQSRVRVLGSALDPGTHVWDVEVGDNVDWLVGVVGGDCLPHSSFVWGIRFSCGEYQVFSLPYPVQKLPIQTNVQRVRVHVDTDTRSLSFSDSLTNTELYTRKNIPIWTSLSDNRTIYPYFYTSDKRPLKIIPCPISVQTHVQE
ncbi:E3 ubiquitin-protein ligase TRIM35-like [Corythoichthys intestinalis]|uniref:E3 ubiquitin-protein ligase TRIM35-like n=1 Tax=Corythoichthys intestinalis TaxID=161448 RepID=UPI0025A52B27|nr:E3 ubiquitin-protein ligase TRIM35-like [Corythoichthys intestinalis]